MFRSTIVFAAACLAGSLAAMNATLPKDTADLVDAPAFDLLFVGRPSSARLAGSGGAREQFQLLEVPTRRADGSVKGRCEAIVDAVRIRDGELERLLGSLTPVPPGTRFDVPRDGLALLVDPVTGVVRPQPLRGLEDGSLAGLHSRVRAWPPEAGVVPGAGPPAETLFYAADPAAPFTQRGPGAEGLGVARLDGYAELTFAPSWELLEGAAPAEAFLLVVRRPEGGLLLFWQAGR